MSTEQRERVAAWQEFHDDMWYVSAGNWRVWWTAAAAAAAIAGYTRGSCAIQDYASRTRLGAVA
jgi:hypothetical protein